MSASAPSRLVVPLDAPPKDGPQPLLVLEINPPLLDRIRTVAQLVEEHRLQEAKFQHPLVMACHPEDPTPVAAAQSMAWITVAEHGLTLSMCGWPANRTDANRYAAPDMVATHLCDPTQFCDIWSEIDQPCDDYALPVFFQGEMGPIESYGWEAAHMAELQKRWRLCGLPPLRLQPMPAFHWID